MTVVEPNGFIRGDEMGVYGRVQKNVKRHDGFVPKSGWIAHMKQICGLPVKKAWNRAGKGRLAPCPADRQQVILDFFKRLELI